MKITNLPEVLFVAVVIADCLIAAILSEYGLAFSTPSNRVFFPIFDTVYPISMWFLVAFLVTSLTSLVYATTRILLGIRVNMESLVDHSAASNRSLSLLVAVLAALFAIPFTLSRIQYSLPGGDTVAYIGMANQFLHFGIGWSLLNDSRPFVDIIFAFVTLGAHTVGLSDQATYLVSSSILMFGSVMLMLVSSFLLLRRNGFDKLTVFLALLLTLASVQTFQLNGGTYANSLALSLLYLSVYLLDKVLLSQGLRRLLLLAGVGTIAALTHLETYGLSSLILLFSALAISRNLTFSDAKKQLTRILTIFSLELGMLSPFIALSFLDLQYFGAFSTYLGSVRAKYFAAFPNLPQPIPPIAFDQTALNSLGLQYGDLPLYFALTASFVALAFRFRKGQCLRSDVYTIVWSAVTIIGASIAYGLSIVLTNPTFDGPLLARRLLFLLPLPLLYSVIIDFVRHLRQ